MGCCFVEYRSFGKATHPEMMLATNPIRKKANITQPDDRFPAEAVWLSDFVLMGTPSKLFGVYRISCNTMISLSLIYAANLVRISLRNFQYRFWKKLSTQIESKCDSAFVY
jgi:hypothetical protein